MFVDAHVHTSGISWCSRVSPVELAEICVRDGLDAVVLTNHCKKEYIEGMSYEDWRVKYVENYEATKKAGEQLGLQVFFGIEVTPLCLHIIDFLLYGLTEEIFLDSPPLYELTQKELYEYAVENGALLYQAHPYRYGAVPQDPACMHGVEINCHPLYQTNERYRVTAFAEKHHLKLSCGSDYHGDTYKAHCGMILPDSVTDSVSFADCLRQPRQCALVIHDIGGEVKP